MLASEAELVPTAGQSRHRPYHSGGTNADAPPLDIIIEQASRYLCLSCRELNALPPQLLFPAAISTLQSLDLSRNSIDSLPQAGLSQFTALTSLDVSRNKLRILPAELPPKLSTLVALSNSLLPLARSLPLVELAALKLTVLDLRYNQKLGSVATATKLGETLPGCEVRLTTAHRQVTSGASHGAPSKPPKPSAAQRDATQLRAQLEPISTPQLRGRLDRIFGEATHPDEVDREGVLTRLVAAYNANGPRKVRRVRGVIPAANAPLDALLDELRRTTFPSAGQRERQTVRAVGYMILPRPLNGVAASEALHASEADPSAGLSRGGGGEGDGGCRDISDSFGEGGGGEGGGDEGGGGEGGGGSSSTYRAQESAKARLAAAKLRRHARIWDLAMEIIAGVDPSFAATYTAIAVTKQFEGSPHIDTENVAPFYGLSLGDFTGGEVCVESDPLEVTYVETKRRLGKIDGRYPHWVAPHSGERYSIIYYVTNGAVIPQTEAVFGCEEAATEEVALALPLGCR